MNTVNVLATQYFKQSFTSILAPQKYLDLFSIDRILRYARNYGVVLSWIKLSEGS